MDEEQSEVQASEPVPENGSSFRYPSGNLYDGIRKICAGRSVHIARAVSINPPTLVSLPLQANASRLILSDTPDKWASCIALAEGLRDLHPDYEIIALAIDYIDYWGCRAAPKSEVVMDLGQLIHDAMPDLVLQRLSLMTTDTVFIATMVLPSFEGPGDEAFPEGRMLSAERVRPPSAIAQGAAASFGQRGLTLAQLDPDINNDPRLPLPGGAWRWFFSATGLSRLGSSLGLDTAAAYYTWHDLAVAIEFRRQ